MSLWSLFKRKKVATEADRHARLLQTGRIAEGTIIDSDGATLEEITRVFYVYTINGADYESAHDLTEEQRRRQIEYAPGSKISVRYDYRQPGNSIVV